MPLTDVNLYLDPWYLSYWTYLEPIFTTLFASISLYAGARELIQLKHGETANRLKGIFWSLKLSFKDQDTRDVVALMNLYLTHSRQAS